MFNKHEAEAVTLPRPVLVRFSEVDGVLNDDENEFRFRRDQDLVFLTPKSEVGQLIGGVEVPDDGVGSFAKLGHHDRVLCRERTLQGRFHCYTCKDELSKFST